MIQFAVNLSTIFTEVPLLERFKKAKESGFSFVEFQFPYSHSIDDIRKQLEEHKLSMVLINLPPGHWEKGDRGLASCTNREEEFRESVEQGIEYALGLGVPNIHCMAGILSTESERSYAKNTFKENITYAAKALARHNLTLLIEPINTFDMPNYYLSNIHEAVGIIEELQLPNVKLQYDFYHIQRTQGNLILTFQRYLDVIGHIQIADVPGRHQPGTGEINYNQVLEYVRTSGYKGYIGLEYMPKEKSEDSFDWIRQGGFSS